MSNLTRKDFIRLSSWTLVAALLPTNEISAVSSVFSPNYFPNNDDFKKAQALAKEAKIFFYKKDLLKAEELYLQCIKLAPNSIRFYDNLDNVYGAKSKHLLCIELYKKGLLNNPKNVAFYDRAARSLMRLELGNKKVTKKLKTAIKSESLLYDAELLYNKAIAIDGSKKYLTIGLEKVRSKMTSINTDSHIKNNLPKRLKKNDSSKQQFKKQTDLKSDVQIEKLIEQVDVKKRVTLYNKEEIILQQTHLAKEKKKYLKLLLSRNKEDKSKSLILTEKLFEADPTDSMTLKKLKNAYYSNNKYFDFIAARQKFAEKKQTVYSYLGVIDSIQIACEKRQASQDSITNAIVIGKMVLSSYSLLENTQVDVVDKLAKLFIYQSNFEEAKKITEFTIKSLTTSSPAVNNKIIYRYASIYYKEGRLEEAKSILRIALKEPEEENTAFQKIKEITLNKEGETFEHKSVLYYLLVDIYLALNEKDNANAIIDKLVSNDPKDKFVLKRK